ncbi:MAG: tRNA pseudouridine(38-40) synthase TruA [bacterium]
MNNYKLIISYNGNKFAGWQQQDNAESVQGKIIDSIEIILKERVNLIGAGRTDTGVHAYGQVANFKTEQTIEDLGKFEYSLNSLLPKEIAIRKFSKVDENFHSRFDAKKRSYIYIFVTEKDPFYNNFTYFLPAIEKYSINTLQQISNYCIGKYDYTSFSKRNSETKNKVCNVYNVNWRKTGNKVLFLIEADRYLHGMVRTIVGTILKCAATNELDGIEKIIRLKNRIFAGESVPAKGLFLYKVKY